MHFPIVREKVGWHNGPGEHLVLRIDWEKMTADLLVLAEGTPRLHDDIPFEELEPLFTEGAIELES